METLVQERLKDLRVERGLTLEQLAEAVGLSKSALGGYETDELKEIGHNTICRLAKFYGVTTDYLLCLSEAKQPSDASIQGLSISDDMVEVLRGQTLNNGLLCELVTRPEFPMLLAEIEVYISGVAATQIANLNVWIDATERSITEKHSSEEHDANLDILRASRIDENEYFRYRINEVMGKILRGLKDDHKDKLTSANPNSAVDELRQTIEEAANFKGSRLEGLLLLFCTQTRINYHKLTEEEKSWLMQIARKSKLYKGGVSQKGKK